jgi:hypothetical protein
VIERESVGTECRESGKNEGSKEKSTGLGRLISGKVREGDEIRERVVKAEVI